MLSLYGEFKKFSTGQSPSFSNSSLGIALLELEGFTDISQYSKQLFELLTQ